MTLEISAIFKKTYKVAGIFLFVVVFFFVYNTYLVDRSIINLKIALNRAVEAKTVSDFEKIRSLLKIPLFQEIAKTSISASELISIELAGNIASTAQDPAQLEDVRFFLNSVVNSKERERGAFMSFLDNLNARIFPAQDKVLVNKLNSQAKKLIAFLDTAKDEAERQRLYYDLGNVYMQLSDLEKARDYFIQAAKALPDSLLAIKAKFNLAWAYKTMGEPEKAISLFAEVTRDYQVNSQYQIADAMYKKGDYQAARDKYAKLSEEYPQFSLADIALYEAGYISLHQLNDEEAAAAYFSQMEKKFRKTNILKHVIEKVRPAMGKHYRKKGYDLLRQKMYTEAITEFQKAVDISPADSTSFTGMGLGFYWLDQKEDALNKAKIGFETSRDDEICFTNYLFICMSFGRADEAIKVGELLLSRRTIKTPEFFYNLGNAYIAKDKIDIAVVQYDRALKLNPDFIFAYNNLGCSLWMAGKYSEAIQMFKRCIDRDPNYADAHFNLGLAYFYSNRYNEAYDEFKRVMDIEPSYKGVKDYSDRAVKALGYQP